MSDVRFTDRELAVIIDCLAIGQTQFKNAPTIETALAKFNSIMSPEIDGFVARPVEKFSAEKLAARMTEIDRIQKTHSWVYGSYDVRCAACHQRKTDPNLKPCPAYAMDSL